MCGITGILANKKLSQSEIEGLISRMADTMIHRGPDDSGIWHKHASKIAFAHRRLSIQDTSSCGKQPMTSRNDRFVITYNGEVYNFQVIALKLKELGYQFLGHSDTEVILAAIEHWGLEDALQKFDGMFAFALWDNETNKIYLVRDRLGEKPLYYGVIDGNFVFTSELKALASQSEFKLEINRNALAQYMRYGYVPTPYSIYNGIYKLQPGTICEIDHNIFKQNTARIIDDINALPEYINIKKYWELKFIAQTGLNTQIENETDAINKLDDLIHSRIRQQMISDVPTGAFLSGGIDSSTVASIMQNESNTAINTFTIGFSEKDFNEAEFAKQISNHLGTNHTELYITPQDALQVVPDLPQMYDEPFADSSQIPAYLVSQLAKSKVTVCLSGDGGDELFAGYNRYIWTNHVWSKIKFIPKPFKSIVAGILEIVPPTYWDKVFHVISRILHSKNTPKSIGIKLHKLAQVLKETNITDVYLNLLSYWDAPETLVLQSKEPSSIVRSDNLPQDCNEFMNKAMYWDLLSYLPDDNLVKVDRASMSSSLETRLPLLDHNIVEFAWKVPLSMKVKNSTSKWILREVLYRYVPKELIERPKMGFSVPIGDWLRGPLRDWAESLLDVNRLTSEGYLNPELVRQRWQEHLSGKRNWQLSLWAVLMFQSWLENNTVSGK